MQTRIHQASPESPSTGEGKKTHLISSSCEREIKLTMFKQGSSELPLKTIAINGQFKVKLSDPPDQSAMTRSSSTFVLFSGVCSE